MEDISQRIGQTIGLQGTALETARRQLVEGPLSTYLNGMNELLARGGGSYFADGRLTIADLKVLALTRWLTRGVLDHVPKDLVDRLAPALVEHQARISGDARVVAASAR